MDADNISWGGETSLSLVPDAICDSMTIVLVIDSRGMQQLKITMPTWQRYRPEMWCMSWLMVYDGSQLTLYDVEQLADSFRLSSVQYASWIPDQSYESQRERMLTAFVSHAPKFVNTEWFLKVDTDAYAREHHQWIDDDVLSPINGQLPAWVASSWAYTKAKGGGGNIVDWARSLEEFGDRVTSRPRLELLDHIDGKRINYPRMASWISIYNANWAMWLSRKCNSICGPNRLPVPSQDTVAWYTAARCVQHRVARRQWAKRLGWSNQSNLNRLKDTCQEIVADA